MGWVSVPENTNFEELYHHGIKNQKWGRRRWQNQDGSYTEAGRIHYGIGKRLEKRKQERAEEKARTEAMKTLAYSAKQQRAEAQKAAHEAQIEAEKAKKELRAAKRENSRFGNITAKIHEKRAAKQEQSAAEKKEQDTSRKADAYVQAIQSGDKKQIEKVARSLNNDEYRKAIERVNMRYELDRAAADAKIAKGKQVVSRITNTADTMAAGANVWNAAAGIVSAFSGANVPKINTKYEDPIDRLKKREELLAKKYETEQKSETARSQKEIANQNQYKAEVERTKSEKAQYDWREERYGRDKEKTETKKAEAEAKRQARVDKVMARLAEPKLPKKPFGAPAHFSAGPSQINEVLRNVGTVKVGKKSPSIPSSFSVATGDKRPLESIVSSINVSKKPVPVAKKNAAKRQVNGYIQAIGNTRLDKYLGAFIDSKDSPFTSDGYFDASKLPKKEREAFFAILNSKM